jgi:hypothetical protein
VVIMFGRDRLPRIGTRVRFPGIFVGCDHSSDGVIVAVERRMRPTSFPGAAPHMETRVQVQFDAEPYGEGDPVACGSPDPFVHQMAAGTELRRI